MDVLEGLFIPIDPKEYRLIISTPQGVFFSHLFHGNEMIQHLPTQSSTNRFIALSDHLEVMDIIHLGEGVLLLVFPKRGELVYKGSKEIN